MCRERIKPKVYSAALPVLLCVVVLALTEELNLSLSTPLTYIGVTEANLHSFLTSEVDEIRGSNSSGGRLTAGQEPRYPLSGSLGWHNSYSKPDRSARNLVTNYSIQTPYLRHVWLKRGSHHRAEPAYNDIGLCDTPSITSDIL